MNNISVPPPKRPANPITKYDISLRLDEIIERLLIFLDTYELEYHDDERKPIIAMVAIETIGKIAKFHVCK
jgi:hypothetical protein